MFLKTTVAPPPMFLKTTVSVTISYMFHISASRTVALPSASQGRAALLQLILNGDHIQRCDRLAISATVRHVSVLVDLNDPLQIEAAIPYDA